jgi:hypothetical protein
MNHNNYASFNAYAEPEIDIRKFSANDILKTPFLVTQDGKSNPNFNMSRTILAGQAPDSKLAQLYFSKENIRRLQKKIKEEIFYRTKGKFKLEEDQSESDLLVCMRATFWQHGNYFEDKLVRQVKQLNVRTIEYIVPDIITAIKQYYSYIKEINEPLKPIPRALNVNNGPVQLPSITTIWQ